MTATNASVPDFEEPRLADAVERLPPEVVDALSFGVVRLDPDGRVSFFSKAERKLSGYRKPALGREFFTEIAPCMNNAGFRTRMDRAMAAGRLDIAFGHVGDFNDADKELHVRVQSATGGGCWIFIKRDG